MSVRNHCIIILIHSHYPQLAFSVAIMNNKWTSSKHENGAFGKNDFLKFTFLNYVEVALLLLRTILHKNLNYYWFRSRNYASYEKSQT